MLTELRGGVCCWFQKQCKEGFLLLELLIGLLIFFTASYFHVYSPRWRHLQTPEKGLRNDLAEVAKLEALYGVKIMPWSPRGATGLFTVI